MPADDAIQEVVTTLPAEMTVTGEIVAGVVHVHARMAIEGNRATAGLLHRARMAPTSPPPTWSQCNRRKRPRSV
jgi:uncharacterized protein